MQVATHARHIHRTHKRVVEGGERGKNCVCSNGFDKVPNDWNASGEEVHRLIGGRRHCLQASRDAPVAGQLADEDSTGEEDKEDAEANAGCPPLARCVHCGGPAAGSEIISRPPVVGAAIQVLIAVHAAVAA